jgi:signal peptidase I
MPGKSFTKRRRRRAGRGRAARVSRSQINEPKREGAEDEEEKEDEEDWPGARQRGTQEKTSKPCSAIGTESASHKQLFFMRQFVVRCQWLWQRVPCRLFLAATVAGLVGVAIGRNLIGPVYMVSGCSMWPTYEPGAMVRTANISSPLQRGDVVVLDDRKGDYALKRIVGLPGETVHIWRGYVFINHRILIEPYVPKCIYTFPRQRAAVFILGDDQYFVLGDNRPTSADSRMYGPVDREQVKRRVLTPAVGRARFGPVILPALNQAVAPHVVSKVAGVS